MPKNTIFVDTSAICALSDKDDQRHRPAAQFFATLSSHTQLVISDFILLESWIVIERRVGRNAALTFYNDALNGAFDIIKIKRDDLLAASRIMGKYADQDFSVVDCTCFSLMEYLDINRVFTFDSHFRVYRKANGTGFEVLP